MYNKINNNNNVNNNIGKHRPPQLRIPNSSTGMTGLFKHLTLYPVMLAAPLLPVVTAQCIASLV
jgi:hypothetical protein